MKPSDESSIEDMEDISSTVTANAEVEHVQAEVNHHEWTSYDDLKLDYGVDDLTENSTDLEKGSEDSTDAEKANEPSDESEEDVKAKARVVAILDALRGNGESGLDSRLGRRVREFQFAQSERARKSKVISLSSALGFFYHLAHIRADIQWAEDAAWRRENGQPYVSWADYEEKRKKKSWKRPYLVYFILISHFCMMLYQFHLGGWTVGPIKENIMIGPPSSTLVGAGGMKAKVMIEEGSWWRLISAAFLHGGIIHYLLNDVCIYIFGRMIEINHGTTALFVVYFLPSTAGFVLSALCNPSPVSVGASGGVFGLMGACVADIVVNWNLMFLVFRDQPGVSTCCTKLKCISLMLFDMVINWILGLMPYIDNIVHIGGWIYGFLVGIVIFERLPRRFFGKGHGLGTKCRGFLLRFLVATLIAGSIAFFGVQLSQSDGETAPYPEILPYVSCAEFPFWTEEKWWYCGDCTTKPITADLFKIGGSAVYNEIELGCPDGSMLIGNVTEFGFDVASQFIPELQGLCRKLC